jgi:hypothetical protein
MLSLFHNLWFINAIGGIALVFIFLSWNAKSRKKILTLQAINLVFFTVHYFLLSAYVGAAMCVVSIGRNYVFIKKNEKKWANHWWWFYFFTLISAGVLVIFWKGWITILPVVGIIVGMHALTKDKPSEIRFYMLIACIIWVPYTIVVQSYSGFLSQAIGIISILIGMYRHDRKKVRY